LNNLNKMKRSIGEIREKAAVQVKAGTAGYTSEASKKRQQVEALKKRVLSSTPWHESGRQVQGA